MLSLDVNRGYKLRQIDVKKVFLQGTLQETIHIAQPLGYVDTNKPDFICKLDKNIYGLMQDPNVWYSRLREFLHFNDFMNNNFDTSIFVYNKDEILI